MRDRGNASVEFVAVVPLLFLVGIAVLQLALLAHAQAVVGAAASQSARAAAVSAQPEPAARAAADEVLGTALAGMPVAEFSITEEVAAGIPVIAVRIEARPDLFLLPDVAVVSGIGRALVEGGP